jgi:Trehalase
VNKLQPDPSLASLAERAREVLVRNDAGRWTVPSPHQYPHQWNWDSAFVSLGWATFDWDRACLEIDTMLESRWRDGMVPHVRYDPTHLTDYFPGPDRWPHAQRRVMNRGVLTSGISNPPMLVLAVHRIGLRQPDVDRRSKFWRRVYAALVAWIRWFGTARRLPGSPLVCVVHPWETGWDNSPRWDSLARAGLKPQKGFRRLDTSHVEANERPRAREYDAYVRLIELLEESRFELDRYRLLSPFVFHDVLINALWYRSATLLNEMASSLGERPPFPPTQLAAFAEAYETAHWSTDLATYVDWDCIAQAQVPRHTAAGVASLVGGIPSRDRAAATWARLQRTSGDAWLVPSLPPTDPAFEARRYWRGPVWAPVNWLVIQGLWGAGLKDEAELLRGETLALFRGGFSEYYDPRDGHPCGADQFSWTAAVALDLLAQSPGSA